MKVKIEKLNSRPKDTFILFSKWYSLTSTGFFRIKIIWRFWLVYENGRHVVDFCSIYIVFQKQVHLSYIVGRSNVSYVVTPPKKTPTSCICEYMVILRNKHINKPKVLFIWLKLRANIIIVSNQCRLLNVPII
jgi:hypothetical protein